MPSQSNWLKVSSLVESDPNLCRYRRFLLSPEAIQKVVRMTNARHIQKAWSFVIQAEWLLQQIQKIDPEIDLTWDYEIIAELRKALEQADTSSQ